MQDARTPSTRLEGLIPKTEDFHTQAEWVKVSGDVEQLFISMKQNQADY